MAGQALDSASDCPCLVGTETTQNPASVLSLRRPGAQQPGLAIWAGGGEAVVLENSSELGSEMERWKEPINLNGRYRELTCPPDVPHEEARAVGLTVGCLYSQWMSGYWHIVVT